MMEFSEASENQVETLTFFIRYRELKASDLAEILLACHETYDGIFEMYKELTSIRPREKPSLQLLEIHTGDSIRFKFVKGWLPQVYSDAKDDIVIGIPKKLAIPLLISYMLLTAADKLLDIKNKYLDVEIKKYEVLLKQSELDDVLRQRDTEKFQIIQRKANDLIRSLVANRSFPEVEINGITIKKHRQE